MSAIFILCILFSGIAIALDLVPSFSSALPYTQTYGVVVVQADFPLSEAALWMREVEMLQNDLSKILDIPAPKEKIELCLFKSKNSYIDFLKKNFPDAPLDRPALFVKKNAPGILLVQRAQNLEIDLRHEMTHAILHASFRDVPIWLDEGLAKYFELPAEKRAFDSDYLKTIRRNAQINLVPSLTRLERLRTIDDMGGREYRDSWAWTHFLLHRSPDTHLLLAQYLQSLAKKSSKNKNGERIYPLLEPKLIEIEQNPKNVFVEHFQSWHLSK